jgi:hypothetical protein
LGIRVTRETHDALAFVERALRLAGGANPYGEPNFRAVWGGSRLTWIGGRWEDRDAAGNLIREVVELRQVPKYLPTDRWHIERWCPPEMYGRPEDWYARTVELEDGRGIPALGPYPQRGEYEHCLTLAGARGEFVQLTPAVAEYLARLIEASRTVTSRERRGALDRRASAAADDYDAWAYDVLDDAVPAFHGLPWIRVPSPRP